jgi:hypothetical protein
MPSSGILRRVALAETNVLPKLWFVTIAIRRNFPEDGILHSHSRENLKSYID